VRVSVANVRRLRVLVAATVATLAASRAMAACDPGDPTCCSADAACDDGNACTLDTCLPDIGCRHDPIDFDALRASIAADVCPGEVMPQTVGAPLGRTATLVERASTSRTTSRSRRLVRMALRKLGVGAAKLKAAGRRGLVSPGCASSLGTAIATTEREASCLLASLAAGAASTQPFACLAGHGPLVHLSGTRDKEYSERSLKNGTRIDARGATFHSSPSEHYPISIGGGDDICLAGGKVRGEYDRGLDWATMHDMNNAGVVFESPTTVDGIRIDDVTDGIRPRGAGPFTIRNVHLSYVRDDCVENDHLAAGLIDDVLFDGCYVALSERPSPSESVDGRGQLVTIRNSLLRLEPMPGPRDGASSELGNGEFFKWSDGATRLALFGNVFMAEKVGQGGADTMGIPDSLTDCADNVMVWLGPGDYPARLPACFKVTKDRAAWDAAVADWLRRHPEIAP